MRTIAFIDAAQFRLSVISSRLTTKKKFDWSLFYAWLNNLADTESKQKDVGLFDVHYFDCMSNTTQETKESFHSFLRNTLGFQLHFTALHEKQKKCQQCQAQYTELEQKGVDVGIAVAMLRLAYCNAYDQAILCSGDGDFAELVNVLRRDLGKRIIITGWQNGVAPVLRDNACRTHFINDNFEKFIRDNG